MEITAPPSQRDIRNGVGALRAFGDHKGSGLALMCELLGGALSGNGCPTPGRRFANGMLSIYIDPVRIDPDGVFPAEAARFISYVKAAKPVPPAEEALLPGEPEARTRAQRLASGIPLPQETWNMLLDMARSLGVDERVLERAASA